MEDDADDAARRGSRSGSTPGGDPLIEALERLRAAEDRRREVPRESAEYAERTRDVEARARDVFRLAEPEEDAGWSAEPEVDGRPDGDDDRT